MIDPATVTRSAVVAREAASTDDGQFGHYQSDSGLALVTGEDPDLGNAPDVSCIPKGRRLAYWAWSAKHQRNLYHLQDTDARVGVELHAGNLCGNKPKGEASDVEGCLIFGLDFGVFDAGSVVGAHPPLSRPQRGVVHSVAALAKLEADMRDPKTGEQLPFWLTIC